MRVVVLAWGNETRGDDGLGPAMAARIEALGLPHVRVIEDFQLQIEHALDLPGHDLVLFIDAGQGTPAPFVFAPAVARRGMTHSSHGLSPEAVLDVFSQVRGVAAPPAFTLCLRGEAFELSESLSSPAQARLEAAMAFLAPLLAAPSLPLWQAAVTPGGAAGLSPPPPALSLRRAGG